MEYTYTDCYNNGITVTDNSSHDDPEFDNFVTIIHIANIYLSNRLVEIIIRDHDDILHPSFYILSEDRSKELYRVSLFDNSYTEGLSKEDKERLNVFLREDYYDNLFSDHNPLYNVFNVMKNWWRWINMEEEDSTPYDNTEAPIYI
jgi:hypothetical protein